MATLPKSKRLWDLIERVEDLSDALDDAEVEAQSLLEGSNFGKVSHELADFLESKGGSKMMAKLMGVLQKVHGEALLQDIRSGESIPEYLLRGAGTDTIIGEVLAYMEKELTRHFSEKVPSIRDSGGKLEFRFMNMDRDVDLQADKAPVYWVGSWQLRGGDETLNASDVLATLHTCSVMKELKVTCKLMDINNIMVMAAEIRLESIREVWLRLNGILD